MGNAASAQRLYREAEKLIDKLADDGLRAQELSRLCELYQRLNNLDLALVYGREAVALRRKTKDMHGEAVSLTDLAAVYRERDDLTSAGTTQQDALILYRRADDKRGEAIAQYQLGLIFLKGKTPLQAIERFEEALKKAHELGYKEGEILALYGLALAEQAQGNLRESRRWVEKVLPLIESSPQRTGNADNAPIAIAKQGSYELLIDLLVSDPPSYTSLMDRVSAFAASERARWRTLREWLVASQDKSSQRLRGDSQLRQMKEAVPEDKETDGYARESSKPGETDISGRAAQIESIRMREAAIRNKAKWITMSASPATTLSQVQSLLDSDTILLEYFLGSGRSYLWMVTPKTVEVFALPDRGLIENKSKEFYDLLASSRSRSREHRAALMSQELSRILLGSLADRLGDKRLVIVRDGAINYVPFAALADPSPTAARWLGGPAPLVLSHEIVYLPSASVLLALRGETQSRPPAAGLMAVVADPEFDREMYEPLPYSRLEGQRLSRLASPKGRVLSAYGFAATRDLVLAGELADFRYLVFATHGINDPLHPELSALVLSQRSPDGQLRKGHLRVQDIKALDLRSDLAFLSGCRTSLGSLQAGEGFMGLSQSFMYAGVPRVIASLWSVREEATPAFSEHVFRGILLDGVTPAQALRRAQLWMAQESEWHSPYYWAGFEIQGDWR
jgi:CHAT domain-containing protein